MQDMLVRLLSLPESAPHVERLARSGIELRRATPADRGPVLDWASEHFGAWVAEIQLAFERDPIACFLALQDGERTIGFAAYDAAFPNFFGPTGVHPDCRGQGIGAALLLSTLEAQRAQGYAYAIIGAVGPAAFYERVVGASLLDGPAAWLVREGAADAAAD